MRTHEADDPLHEIVRLGHYQLRLLRACIAQEISDGEFDAAKLCSYLAEQAFRLRILLYPASQQVHPRDHSCQRILDLVGYARGHFPHGCQLRGSLHLLVIEVLNLLR